MPPPSPLQPKPADDKIEELKHVDTLVAFHKHPRPSNRPEDPLNWPIGLKIAVLVQVSWLAALGTWNTAVINAAFLPLATDMGVSEVVVSYSTTIAIALNGIGPFIWIPLANVYGRRSVYLLTTAIGTVSALGCGFVQNYAQLLGVRAVNGLFPVSLALGPATVTDLFFYHQRGRATGIFTVFLTSGAHVAGLFGGPVGQFLGWRWIFWITSIMNLVTLIILIFCLPETVYYTPRTTLLDSDDPPRLSIGTYKQLLRPWTTFKGVTLKAKHFILPSFRMAKYPSVLLPALYYATQYCFAAIFPAVTYAQTLSARFGWDTLQCGLAYGGTMTLGSIMGEFFAGRLMDKILRQASKTHHDANPPLEVRLKGIWPGAVLVPAGLLIFGFTMQYNSHWTGPLAGMFIGIFGLQIAATATYTYSVDCYRIEGSEVAQLFNVLRQETSFTVASYAIKLCDSIGFQFAFLIFALVGGVLAFAPMVFLMQRGQSIRERLGEPQNVSVAEEVLARHRQAYDEDY